MSDKRNKYPWDSLVEVGNSFTLTLAEHSAGYKFARQLVFAQNATRVRQNKPERFKCEKTAEGMKISRVA